MPLHGEQPTAAVGELEAFDDAVVGAADDAQAVAELVDRLMVVTRADGTRVAPITFASSVPASSVHLVRAAAARLAGPAVRLDAGVLGDVLVAACRRARR